MKKELEDKIVNDFPGMFKHRDNLKASLMAFGFECNDGWFDLIHNLCRDINAFYNGKIPEQFYVQQVKEKFGGLRFYVSCAPEEVFNMIHAAEGHSYSICENCGKEHQPSEGEYTSFYRDALPWIVTLCDECLDKHIAKIYNRIRKANEDYISNWQKEHNAPFVKGV